MSTSKTGKHGHAKCAFVAVDIFTGAPPARPLLLLRGTPPQSCHLRGRAWYQTPLAACKRCHPSSGRTS